MLQFQYHIFICFYDIMFLPSQICVRGRHLESHDLDSKNRKKILEKKNCTHVICDTSWHPRSINTLLCSLFKFGTNTWYSLPLIANNKNETNIVPGTGFEP